MVIKMSPAKTAGSTVFASRLHICLAPWARNAFSFVISANLRIHMTFVSCLDKHGVVENPDRTEAD